MPALNFQPRFAEMVERGEKRQTIRTPRRDGRPHAVPGAPLYLFTGMRSPSCRRLLETVCTRTRQIVILENWSVLVDGTRVAAEEEEAFARADGFDSFAAFIAFFEKTHGLPVEAATLIEWDPSRAPEPKGKQR